jgi:hypothetical protein
MLKLTRSFPLKRSRKVLSLKHLCANVVITYYQKTDYEDLEQFNQELQSLPPSGLELITEINRTEKLFHSRVQDCLVNMYSKEMVICCLEIIVFIYSENRTMTLLWTLSDASSS